MQDLTPPQPRQRAETSAAQLARLAGEYRAVTWRFSWTPATWVENDRLKVTLREGKIYTEFSGGRPRELIPVTGTHFRRADEPIATSAFIEHDGNMYLQGDFGNYQRVRP